MNTKSRKRDYQTKAGRERRHQILNATQDLLKVQKIKDVSLKDIARAADIPLSSIYNLFKNLDDIHVALVNELWHDLLVFRSKYLRDSYQTFTEMVTHSTEVNLAFIQQNDLVKKIIYSDEVPAAIKSADQDMLVQHIRAFVSAHLPAAQLGELERTVETFRRTVVVFDALVMDSISRHGTVPQEDQAEIISIMKRLSE